MHNNFERRFINLATRQSAYHMALEQFRARYHLLFDALAIEMGYDRALLAAQLGFDPVPRGGNQIMNGEAEASVEDCLRLMGMYLEHTRTNNTPKT